MPLNNRTKFIQNHNHIITPDKSAVTKLMFEYYLNMSDILLHHSIKTTTPFADALVQGGLAEFLVRLDNTARLSSSTEVKL